ncbi:hypothetical protein NA8A_03030 [Nitratireductor indicus C115]|uniref:DUF1009 domain-containing protein n=1 Tax=Nitratireductor indicus C115 TaxID=1231190 RepID=K2PRR2_9HYPH|nr:hypothetical protein NA8A_03030 [Nitratireductor indicus C115]SFQ17642.1 hypothetical protein SAMN05216176_101710 [Nitratireductor indicus]
MPQGARIAVVAGSGSLPRDVVSALVRAGYRPLVVAIEQDADHFPVSAKDFDVWPTPVERLGLVLPKLKRAGVTHLVLAGGVSQRPPILKVRFGLDILKVLPRLIAAYARGDDGLLRAVIAYIEENGIKVVGAHEIAPDLLAPAGVITRSKPTKADEADIAAAFEAARTIGALDIGQAAIAVGGRAVALEGIEGTAGLLARMRDMRDHGRLAGRKRGVLVKCVKPKQELRADLPTIGPETVDAVHAAGLVGIAVEAGRSLIMDHDETLKRADKLGIFVVGLERPE